MPGFHNRYTGMPGVNSYSMPGLANCDTGHKALMPGVSVQKLLGGARERSLSCIFDCRFDINNNITVASSGPQPCLKRQSSQGRRLKAGGTRLDRQLQRTVAQPEAEGAETQERDRASESESERARERERERERKTEREGGREGGREGETEGARWRAWGTQSSAKSRRVTPS